MLSKILLKKIKDQLLLEKSKLTEKAFVKLDIDTDGDETDEVQGNMLIELENQLSTRNNNKLHQIDDAIKRIDNKTYGLCQDCEEEISEKRLICNPYCITCIGCAEDRELELKRKRF